MRKKEQLIWDAWKHYSTQMVWLQRIENIVGEGMPDVYVGGSGRWVELKAPSKIPKRPETPLLGAEGLRVSQKNWHQRNAKTKGAPLSYILIRTVERELILVPGSLAPIVNDLSLDELRGYSLGRTWDEINKAVMI